MCSLQDPHAQAALGVVATVAKQLKAVQQTLLDYAQRTSVNSRPRARSPFNADLDKHTARTPSMELNLQSLVQQAHLQCMLMKAENTRLRMQIRVRSVSPGMQFAVQQTG